MCSAKNESSLLHVSQGLTVGATVSDYRRSVSGEFHKQCLLLMAALSARLCSMILYRLWKAGAFGVHSSHIFGFQMYLLELTLRRSDLTVERE